MPSHRPLLIVAALVIAVTVIVSCASPTPVPPTPRPIDSATPFAVTPEPSLPDLTLPTLTPTPQPTPLPTKPRPGYTPVPDDVVSPVVIDRSPLPGEAASPDGAIQLVFDRAMDRSAVESAFQVYPATPGEIKWTDDRTLVFTPAQKLQRAGVYDVVIDQRARDAQGAPLNQAYQFRFATAGYLEVAQVIPAPATADAEPGSTITVIFNRPIVPLTNLDAQQNFPQPVRLTANNTPIEGTGEWLNTSIYVFRPAQPLPGGTIINAAVSGDLVDTDGNPMAAAYNWQFAVAPPKVVYVTPSNGANLVPIESALTVQFNQPISLDSARQFVTLSASDGRAVALDMSVLSETLTLTPTARLDFETAYVLKVAAGVTGRSGGTGMRETVTSLFTTVPLPRVLSTDPADGQRDAWPYTDFTIRFNTFIDHDTVMDHLTFNPPLSPTQVYTYGYGDTFGVNFGAQPSTDYEVRIAPGIKDPYGNETQESLTVRFRTRDLEPEVRWHIPDLVGTYNAYDPARVYLVHTNIKSAEFTLYRLATGDFAAIQSRAYDYEPPATTLLRQWSQAIEAPLNKTAATPIDLAPGGGTLPPGLYLLDVNSPQLRADYGPYARRHVLVVSNINLTLKTSGSEALVWATDYRSGQPVSNLSLKFYTWDDRQIGTATTDADGVARLTGSNVNSAWSDEPFTAIASNWARGIAPYDFGLDSYYGNPEARYNTYIYTDRPIYRPGQTVDFKGIVRAEQDVKYTLPDVTRAHVTIYSPNGETVFDRDLTVSPLGTFFGDVTLADGAALGDYTLNAQINNETFSSYFTVAAYRAPEFEVLVTPKDSNIVRGQSTSAQVNVNYFFGGGVANRPVEWNVLAEDYFFTPPWGGNYSWQDVDDPWICFDCWWFSRYTPPPQPILSGRGVTDRNGALSIELPGDLKDTNGQPITQSVRLIVEATVTGADNQVISGRGSITRHSGEFYVGVQTRDYVGEENRPSAVDVIAVDWDGNRLANKAIEVSVVRREWQNRFIENELGGGTWQSEVKDTPVTTLNVNTNDQGEASITFTPPQAGSYKITAKAVDDGRREIRASVFMWVTGREFVSWRRDNNDRISLIGDKSSYAPGETARILIPSPFQGEHWALVTIERGGILRHELLRITGNSQIYELPITADLAPNFYFSIVLVKGQDDTNKLSDYKVGLLPIEVRPIAQTLNITLTPDRATALPGEEVTYRVRATTGDGLPVQAEFSLDLVDKAVLSLKPRVPDAIVQGFYGKRGLNVNTASALSVSVNKYSAELQQRLDEGLRQRATTSTTELPAAGGGAAPMAPQPTMAAAPEAALAFDAAANATPLPAVEVRQEFADTAYWNPQISTDANGETSVNVKLPDNLTTWVFRGVGVTTDTRVGETTVDVVATKPVLIRPVTPRFFVVGDKAELAANLSNNTDAPVTATVTLSATGVALNSPAQQTIAIEAKGEANVAWNVEVQDVASTDLVFIVQAGEFTDASKPRLATGPDGALRVLKYVAPDIVGTAGQLKEAGARTEIIALPPRYDVQQGGVSIQVDPSLAAGMVNGLDYLEHYPYECAEQTVSRFLPNVLTYRALRDLGIDDPALAAKLPDLVNEGLDKLYARQKEDGGWGWWIDDESNPHLTAYVVYGLQQARNAGFAVRGDVLERAEQFLLQSLSSSARDLTHWQANRQAWLLFVLSEDGKAPADKLNALFEERAKLSHFAKAYLALALGKGHDLVQSLLSDLNNAAILSATGAHWEEDNYDWWSMNTDTRSTAIILSAYARLDPENALAPNVVRWLMIARKVGHWETTQETAWALIGLTDWLRVTGELRPNFDYAVFLNDRSMSEGQFTPANVQQPIKLSVAIRDLIADEANRLTFSRGPGEGVMYYTAHLEVYQPVEDLKPVDRGVIVSRRYTLASCTEADRRKCEDVTQVKLGDVIRVDLTLVAPNDLYYVVVEDPLPAGAEAIDTGLATTSLLDQDPTLIRQPPYDEAGMPIYRPFYWWWNWYSRSELRDEKVVLFADYLGKGTYEYSYTMRATLPGEYKVIPTVAQEFYLPEVFGRSDGRLLTIAK